MIYSEPYRLANLDVRQCIVCNAPVADVVKALTTHAQLHADQEEEG